MSFASRWRPGPEGDWTSFHPWGDCGPKRGELCWSRARCRRHHHPSPTPRPSDPYREHRSVKKERAHLLQSAGPPYRFKFLESNIRQVTQAVYSTSSRSTHMMPDCFLGEKWLPFILLLRLEPKTSLYSGGINHNTPVQLLDFISNSLCSLYCCVF